MKVHPISSFSVKNNNQKNGYKFNNNAFNINPDNKGDKTINGYVFSSWKDK